MISEFQALFEFVTGSRSLPKVFAQKRIGVITWPDAHRVADTLLKQIKSSWAPDLVIGLGRSGALWGGWLAGNLGALRIAVVDCSYSQPQGRRAVSFPGGNGVLSSLLTTHALNSKVLVVEGAATTGQTFAEFIKQHEPQLCGWNIRFAVLYTNVIVPDALVQYVGQRALEPWPEKFPWHQSPSWPTFLHGGPSI